MTSPVQARTTPNGRTYVHPIEGDVYPSVTSILDSWPKPWMGPWTARQVATYAADNAALLDRLDKAAWVDLVRREAVRYTNRAAGLGSAIHHAVESYLDDESLEVTQFDQQTRPYIRAFIRFLEDWEPTYHRVEVTGYHKTYPQYAGTVDGIVSLPTLGTRVLDVKTGRGVYETHALQLAAYCRFETLVTGPPWFEDPMPPVEGAVILHLKPDLYDLVEVDTGDDVWRLFRAVAFIDGFMRTPRALVDDHQTPPQKRQEETSPTG